MKIAVMIKLAIAKVIAAIPQNFQFLELDCQKYKQIITLTEENTRNIASPP